MPAQPYYYHVAQPSPTNLFTLAAPPGGSAGLTDGKTYSVMNRSELNDVYYEERETSGDAGAGKKVASAGHFFYRANRDSPMFVWTDPDTKALLVLSELPDD